MRFWWRTIKDYDLLLTSNLVSHSLGLDDGNVINDSLVDVEVLGEPIESWLEQNKDEI